MYAVTMDQEMDERFRNVLDKGNTLLKRHVISDPGSPDRVDSQLCFEWQSQSLTLLQAVFGSGHVYATNFEAGTTYSGQPMNAPYAVKSGMGVLTAAEEDLAKGWTRKLSELLHAEVFDDFLEMAEHLLKNGYHVAAIVLAGGTMEEHLRKLSVKNALPIADSAAKMNEALWKKAVYPKPTWRRIQAWYDLRTDAAHGISRTYTDAEGADMIKGISDFISQYPA